MKFKVGDKVSVRDEAKGRGMGIWGKVGVVVEHVKDGTTVERISIEYDDADKQVGVDAGLFEHAKPTE